jgi:hypothetical protein
LTLEIAHFSLHFRHLLRADAGQFVCKPSIFDVWR